MNSSTNFADNKIVAVTGANGMIGAQLCTYLHNNGVTVIPLTSADMDITSDHSVHRVLSELTFDVLIHLAAYTAVDKAEQEPDVCYAINGEGTKHVGDACETLRKSLIYVSTDFVFDGQKNHEYMPTDTPNPLGVYGNSKWQGEKTVEGRGTTVRISYPYGPKQDVKKDIVQTIGDLLKDGKSLRMVTDSLFTPTYIPDILEGLYTLSQQDVFPSEIIHIGGSETLSPYDLGLKIAHIVGASLEQVHTTTFEEFYAGKAKRPQYMTFVSSPGYRKTPLDEALHAVLKPLKRA